MIAGPNVESTLGEDRNPTVRTDGGCSRCRPWGTGV